ncbi:flagellar motor switch phosphatase FliY [Sediminispirochaeta bajacaliforniensis]|uniref:flagellar motor switch phosphatase FliY n=1 Tax=Sediminispirochaeta bajacaliforniensis TaxID=148 RepID=UPI000362A250|nr:flagellar motor switch phosphatase FliY [Sediminispirochaeta bajacaliforniensis]
MSDGSLSQDEIDALLQGGGMDFGAADSGADQGLSPQERNRFAELLGGIVGPQASNLSGMIDENVDLKAPKVEVLSPGEAGSGLPDRLVEIKIDYSDGISGEHSYLIPEDIAVQIAGKMMGQEGVELNEAALSAIEEAGNTLAGSAATVIGDSIGKTVMNAPGDTKLIDSSDIRVPAGSSLVRASYPLVIDDTPPSYLYEIFSVGAVQEILGASGGPAQAPQSGMNMNQQSQVQGGAPGSMGGANMGNMGMNNMGMGAMPGYGGGQGMYNQANVQPVQFPPLNPQMVSGEQGNIGLLMDVYMEMTVELGRTKRLIKDILGMGEGTIIELDKLAGEPVDILVNHKLIAKGEVVVIDENFGVRVTEIVSPMDRVEGFS